MSAGIPMTPTAVCLAWLGQQRQCKFVVHWFPVTVLCADYFCLQHTDIEANKEGRIYLKDDALTMRFCVDVLVSKGRYCTCPAVATTDAAAATAGASNNTLAICHAMLQGCQ